MNPIARPGKQVRANGAKAIETHLNDEDLVHDLVPRYVLFDALRAR